MNTLTYSGAASKRSLSQLLTGKCQAKQTRRGQIPVGTNGAYRDGGFFGKGLDRLHGIPQITVDLDSLLLDNVGRDEESLRVEIQCQNVLERPPTEGFCKLSQRFLPLQAQDLSDSDIRLRQTYTDRFRTWKIKFKSVEESAFFSMHNVVRNTKFKCYERDDVDVQEADDVPSGWSDFGEATTNSESEDANAVKSVRSSAKSKATGSVKSFGSGKSSRRKRNPHLSVPIFQRMVNFNQAKLTNVLDEYPFGPSNLHSKSCISYSPESCELSFIDCDGSLKLVKSVLRNDGRLQQKANPVKVDDPHFSKRNPRIYGFDKTKRGGNEKSLFAMRYFDGVSLIDRANPEEVMTRIPSVLHSTHYVDTAFMPYLDSIAVLDTAGVLQIFDYNRGVRSQHFCNSVLASVRLYEWGQLEASPASIFNLRALSREGLVVFDTRAGEEVLNCFTSEVPTFVGGFCSSRNSFYQAYCTTNRKTVLFDERWPKQPMTEWFHAVSLKQTKVPSGINSYFSSDDNLEYVASWWSNGDVSFLCNDWSHKLCSDRVADGDPEVKISCSLNNSEILYPVSRGHPVSLQSAPSLLNDLPFKSDRSRHRIGIPWSGLKMIPGETSLNLVGSNMIGDLFSCVISKGTPPAADRSEMDQDESWFNDGFDFTRAEAFQDLDDDDHQQQLDITDALSVSRVSDTFDPSKTYTYDNITAPVDDHSLRYLESRSLTATELSMLSKWEDEYLKQSFPKFSFVSHVYSRDPLPVGRKKKRTMRKIAKKRSSKVKKAKAKTKVRHKFKHYETCPHLNKLNVNSYGDAQAHRIVKIFEDQTIFPELELSDSESDAGFRSRSLKKRQKRARITGLPEDVSYTMEQFMRGLDHEANMTSTQEQEQQQAPSSQRYSQESSFDQTIDEQRTISQSFDDSHSMPSKSSGARKKRKEVSKKKKHMTGF